MLNQRRTSPRGVTFYILIAYIVLPSATGAVVGDLNLDGVVDFDDSTAAIVVSRRCFITDAYSFS